MKVKKAFKIWKRTEATKSDFCKYGGVDFDEGFGFCKSDNHNDVVYAGKHCPVNCTEFEKVSNKELFEVFLAHYRNWMELFNVRYHIDPNDKYYQKSYSDPPPKFEVGDMIRFNKGKKSIVGTVTHISKYLDVENCTLSYKYTVRTDFWKLYVGIPEKDVVDGRAYVNVPIHKLSVGAEFYWTNPLENKDWCPSMDRVGTATVIEKPSNDVVVVCDNGKDGYGTTHWDVNPATGVWCEYPFSDGFLDKFEEKNPEQEKIKNWVKSVLDKENSPVGG